MSTDGVQRRISKPWGKGDKFNYKPKVLLRARDICLSFTILKTEVGLEGMCWKSSVVLAFMLISRESIKPPIQLKVFVASGCETEEEKLNQETHAHNLLLF